MYLENRSKQPVGRPTLEQDAGEYVVFSAQLRVYEMHSPEIMNTTLPRLFAWLTPWGRKNEPGRTYAKTQLHTRSSTWENTI